MTDTVIAGSCDPRFAAVREAFAANFAERGEIGAAVAISVDGGVVVDLWGGWCDAARARPWQGDTLVNFFSVGKGLTAICVHRLVERDLVDLDAPMARYWPELGRAGKRAVTLRQILCHRAGLPALRARIPDGAMVDWEYMTRALEQQEPWWPPGTAQGYHVNTFGYLIGEVVRRVSGITVGRMLRDEVAGPLDADVHIGLPDCEHARVAECLWPAVDPMPDPGEVSEVDRMRWNTYWNPPGFSGLGWVNRPEWRRAEIPSTNGHGSARGLARIYAALADGGRAGALGILAPDTLAEATREHSYELDRVTQRPTRFALGFQLSQPERPLGPNPGGFGHFGAGGALGFCDPQAKVGFGYVMNQVGAGWQSPRNRALIDALYACL